MTKRRSRSRLLDPTNEIQKLHDYLATLSSDSLCGYMENLRMVSDGALVVSRLGLQSPYREITYAMGLAATTPEPRDPASLDERRMARLLEAVHNRYGARYNFFGESDPDKLRVALGAFAKRFFAGPFMNVAQVVARVRDYFIPFDDDLAAATGMTATAALNVVDTIRGHLQAELERINDMYRFAESPILTPAGRAVERRRAERASAVSTSQIALSVLETAVGKDLADRYLRTFGLRRGMVKDFFWFDDLPNPFAERPVIMVGEGRLRVPVINQIFLAVWTWGERALSESSAREQFFRYRGKQLERDTNKAIRRVLADAEIFSPVFERPGSDEHDLMAILGDTAVVVEAKAGRPPPALRDVEKAFRFVEQQFSSDTGIQSGYDQAAQLCRRLLNDSEPVALYDEAKNVVWTVQPGVIKRAYSIVVTLDEFGMLATDLSALLKKRDEEPYPWAVNIYDLELFVDVFVEKRHWDSQTFIRWLDERREAMRLHSFATDDELEIAGIFITHGTLTAFPKNTTVIGLRKYSNVFEDFSHEKLGDIPAELREPEPADIKDMLEVSSEVKAELFAERARSAGVGRNDRCPCGSGKKYKMCHLLS